MIESFLSALPWIILWFAFGIVGALMFVVKLKVAQQNIIADQVYFAIFGGPVMLIACIVTPIFNFIVDLADRSTDIIAKSVRDSRNKNKNLPRY